ncbi:MAG TPA: DUF2437 domain-containing protein [Anaerolineales bacterium]
MPRFVRYQRDLQIGFGLLEQEGVVPLTGWIYDGWQVAGEATGKGFDTFQPLVPAIVTDLDRVTCC